jgi:hypothetical protein
MQYNILVFNPLSGEHRLVNVKGYPIKSNLAPDVTFFAHRPYEKENDNDPDLKLWWNISEFESGLSLIQYCEGTKQGALKAMDARLLHLETDIPNWIKEQKAKSIELYGIVNK